MVISGVACEPFLSLVLLARCVYLQSYNIPLFSSTTVYYLSLLLLD